VKYQRVAVLGSNSFAGAAFVARALKYGATVIGFNRSAEASSIFLPYKNSNDISSYNFIKADVNNDLNLIIKEIDFFRPQVIVDFAGQGMVAESWSAPEQWYTTNIVAKVRLHDHLRKREWLERFVRISTPEVYGSQSHVLRENWTYNPSTPYAVSHAAIDMSLRAFHKNYQFPVIFTRFANFYGPGQQLYRIVPRAILCALTGRRLKLHGGGTSIRAFIYIDDIVEAITRTLEKGAVGECYQFSSDRFITIRQLVEIIADRMGVNWSDLVESCPERAGKDAAYLMDASKAKAELGWDESTSLEQGIDATIEWLKRNLEEIKTLPWDYIHKV